MGKAKMRTPEQIVNILHQVEVANANGKTQPKACREAGTAEQTFYRAWSAFNLPYAREAETARKGR
jgi:hypothetical protein